MDEKDIEEDDLLPGERLGLYEIVSALYSGLIDINPLARLQMLWILL